MINYNQIITELLNKRGIVTDEDIEEFLSDKPQKTYDPSLLADAQAGVDFILAEIAAGSKICIYGDYDADGITSTALMLSVLRKLMPKEKLDYYIPSRFEEGYNLLEYMCRLNKETGEFVKKITKFYFDFHWEWEHIIGCVINDPLAVAYFINPELCKGFDSYVQIETEGISLGQSVVDSMNFYRKASNARVLTEVDVYGFFQMFLSRILDQKPEELDILQDLIRGDLK